MCETFPLARVPSTASLWMACEITPLFKRSPNLPSYPHVLRVALFWGAREPCFSLYAFQLSTWYKRIQNVADLLLRSMVIFSPTRDGHESVPRYERIHISRRARSPARMFARVCAQSCDVAIGDKKYKNTDAKCVSFIAITRGGKGRG